MLDAFGCQFDGLVDQGVCAAGAQVDAARIEAAELPLGGQCVAAHFGLEPIAGLLERQCPALVHQADDAFAADAVGADNVPGGIAVTSDEFSGGSG